MSSNIPLDNHLQELHDTDLVIDYMIIVCNSPPGADLLTEKLNNWLPDMKI